MALSNKSANLVGVAAIVTPSRSPRYPWPGCCRLFHLCLRRQGRVVNRRTRKRDRLPGRRRLNNRPLGGPLTRQRAIRLQGGIVRRRLGQIRWSLPTGRRRGNPPEECGVPPPPVQPNGLVVYGWRGALAMLYVSTSSGYATWKVIPSDASDRMKIRRLKRPSGGTTRPMRSTSGLGAKRWTDRL
jgi:hypothetical protein